MQSGLAFKSTLDLPSSFTSLKLTETCQIFSCFTIKNILTHPSHFWFHTGCYAIKNALCIQTQAHQQFKEMSQRYFGSLFILFKKFKCPCAVVLLNSRILFDWKVGHELTRLVETDNRIWNYHLSMKWNDAVFVPDRSDNYISCEIHRIIHFWF